MMKMLVQSTYCWCSNYRYVVKAFIKLDESLHGVVVVIPTNDREIPGSIPGRCNLQIKITSTS